jgi:hypothetical protein
VSRVSPCAAGGLVGAGAEVAAGRRGVELGLGTDVRVGGTRVGASVAVGGTGVELGVMVGGMGNRVEVGIGGAGEGLVALAEGAVGEGVLAGAEHARAAVRSITQASVCLRKCNIVFSFWRRAKKSG